MVYMYMRNEAGEPFWLRCFAMAVDGMEALYMEMGGAYFARPLYAKKLWRCRAALSSASAVSEVPEAAYILPAFRVYYMNA